VSNPNHQRSNVAHRNPLIRRGAGDPGLFYVPPHLSPPDTRPTALPTKRLRAQSGTHVQTPSFPALSRPIRGGLCFFSFLIRRGRGRWRFCSCVCIRGYELDRGFCKADFCLSQSAPNFSIRLDDELARTWSSGGGAAGDKTERAGYGGQAGVGRGGGEGELREFFDGLAEPGCVHLRPI
jgi:hypothetical protein